MELAPKIGVPGATIVLRSGAYFDYLNPDPASIQIEDIAWGLANTCRFAGQSLEFYSVAQHSVHVADAVPFEHRFPALLHDAAEAYIGDVPGPLKQLLPDYKAVEARVEQAVAARFGLTLPWHPEIKEADLRVLRTEQRDLTAGSADTWSSVEGYAPLQARIVGWPPHVAAREFLAKFERLVTFGGGSA